MYTSLFCLYKKSGLLPSILVFYSSEHNWFYQFLIPLLSIRKKENSGFNEICSSSGLLVAYGDSLIPMLWALPPQAAKPTTKKLLRTAFGSEEPRRMESEQLQLFILLSHVLYYFCFCYCIFNVLFAYFFNRR